ncbi:Glutathione S-transferase 1, isoform D [Papilio machaon]|uniref:Glutathione S-transferase 1, isoform D n=1 Tax=Papilio machaon TaxID=76193 RepID=A0A194R132_PAPMA|nr:Glutathione S-transferase 1, isoform D [Papilio machaon]
MSSIKLYYYPVSGPARIALMAARLVGVPLQIEIVDLMKREQFSEAYLKINPQHCVPTLDDDGFILSESRAIACYLADKYGTDDSIYPKDIKKRAIHPIIFNIETEIKENLRDDFNASLSVLDKYLENNEWVAGEHITIADTTIFASMSGIFAAGWDLSYFPNIQRWLKNCSNLPGYEEIKEGAKIYGDLVKKNLKQ